MNQRRSGWSSGRGGNAFAGANEDMIVCGQFAFAARALALLASGYQLLLTHGNGPQVGYILTRVEEALGKAYSLPLEVCWSTDSCGSRSGP